MLSEETAVGHDPVGAVQMMSRLLCETEPLLGPHEGPTHRDDANALAHAAATLAEELNAAAIVVPTRTGMSAMRRVAINTGGTLTAAKQIIDRNYFTSQQVKEMVLLFTFENNRLDVAKYAYGKTVDKVNYFVMNDAFTFNNNKEALKEYIREYQ
jgi:pyruvate kinase